MSLPESKLADSKVTCTKCLSYLNLEDIQDIMYHQSVTCKLYAEKITHTHQCNKCYTNHICNYWTKEK